MLEILNQTKKILKLRNYSVKTQKSYLFYIKQFLTFSQKHRLKNKNIAVEKFLLQKLGQQQSPQTVNLALNSLKFFYKEIIGDPLPPSFKFAKHSKKLPVVLSKNKIFKIIKNIDNAKYRLAISLAYASGLGNFHSISMMNRNTDD